VGRQQDLDQLKRAFALAQARRGQIVGCELLTGDFRPVLEALLGEDAAGLSPATIARLTAAGRKNIRSFAVAS
jgi:hypothetical protein